MKYAKDHNISLSDINIPTVTEEYLEAVDGTETEDLDNLVKRFSSGLSIEEKVFYQKF